MLKALHLSNFKAWRRVENATWQDHRRLRYEQLRKEQSCFEFLLLLKQTKNATDRGLVLDFGGPGELVNMGGYRDVVNRGNERLDIEVDTELGIVQ